MESLTQNSSFNNFFSTYEATDPPPVIPDDYKEVETTYKNYLQPQQFIDFNQVVTNPDNGMDIDWGIDLPKPAKQSSNTNGIVSLARSFVGSKYVWGGSSPKTGFDCSGLIQYVFKQNGIQLPRTVKEIEKLGTTIPLSQVQPGDLISSTSRGPSGRHIRLVSKIENGQIWTIDARGKKYGVVEEPLQTTSNIISVKRIMNSYNNNYNHRFGQTSNKFQEFADVMYPIYNEVVSQQGLNPNVIPYLIKQDALESNYGLSPRGNGYNLGGIKGSPLVSTRWIDGQYYRNFNNLKDYVTYKVNLLNNRYNAFQATSERDFINRLHGNNPAGYSYSQNPASYSRNFQNLASLDRALNKYEIYS